MMAFVKRTQDSLGKYVSRPPLTDKLLAKPPFRFLHDIISALIREHKVFQGLYNSDEMKSENCKDKDSKVKYLQKILDCTAWALDGKPLAAKPGKIVSGQEPDKTNEFLQALARVIEARVDTRDAVKRVLAGDKPGQSPVKSTPVTSSRRNSLKLEAGKSRSGSRGKNDAVKSRENSSSRRSSLKQAGNTPRDMAAMGQEEQPVSVNSDEAGAKAEAEDDIVQGSLQTISEQDSLQATSLELTRISPEADKRPEELPTDSLSSTPRPPTTGGASPSPSRPVTGYGSKSRTTLSNGQQPDLDPEHSELVVMGADETSPNPDNNERHSGAARLNSRPGSAVRSARPITARLKTARPPSARPAAPRLKDKIDPDLELPQARPQTGKVTNLIVDSGGPDDDAAGDGDNEFLVEERPSDNADSGMDALLPDDEVKSALAAGGQEHGALVQQIIRTQKELDPEVHRRVEIEHDDGGVGDAGGRREREVAQREVDKLCASIQKLTMSANPLAKLMDFLQEDVDAMQRELEAWRAENKDLRLQLRREQETSLKSVQPLRAQLAELEAAIDDQLDKISSVKANILRNEEKASRMIGSLSSSG